jgi:hypothetical protein
MREQLQYKCNPFDRIDTSGFMGVKYFLRINLLNQIDIFI